MLYSNINNYIMYKSTFFVLSIIKLFIDNNGRVKCDLIIKEYLVLKSEKIFTIKLSEKNIGFSDFKQSKLADCSDKIIIR